MIDYDRLLLDHLILGYFLVRFKVICLSTFINVRRKIFQIKVVKFLDEFLLYIHVTYNTRQYIICNENSQL